MTPARLSRLLLAPAVLLTAGACFATRADLRIVQGDVLAVRDSVRVSRLAAERRDSLARAATDSALARVVAALATVGDSVVAVRGATQRMDGALREDLHAIRQQLITIQELTGQSQRRIQELRADLESDAVDRTPGAVVPPAAVDTSRGTAAGAPAGPGPAQLYQLGQDQLRRGSNAAARGAFTTLLTQHPSSDLGPDALYGIAESFTAEGNGVRADSVYHLVATRYPQSERAPIALYKRATAYRLVGQTERAQTLYRQIVETYPSSESARLAQGFLTPRRP